MSKFNAITLIVCGLLYTACSSPSNGDSPGDTNKDQTEPTLNKGDVSYALGYNFGDVLADTDAALQLEDMIQGLKDAYSRSQSTRMKDEQVKMLLIQYNQEISESFKQRRETLKEENLQKGKDFVAKYQKESGVKKSPSGFFYKIIEEGKGSTPQLSDDVVVEYTGKNIEGIIFSTTDSLDKPLSINVSNVIKGWQEALRQMPVGSTWEIVIPAELAYGDKGVPGIIEPGETLIFQMRLIDINEGGQDPGSFGN